MRLSRLLMSCAVPAMAQDFLLELPVDCVLGESCYIQNYVDADPTGTAANFLCGSLTYDTHKGTDFGLPSLAAMNNGVEVLAAAEGIVRGTRNNMRDVLYTDELAGEINGRDCGNGIVLSHDNGWETQYCHLMEGSVSVQTGQRVKAGETIGLIGLSGRTQFPHLHLSVRRNGEAIDPFDPEQTATCNIAPNQTLWSEVIETPQGGLLSVGFSDGVPDFDDVKAGTASRLILDDDSPVVLWALAFGTQPDDIIAISFSGPDGPLFETRDVLDRTQALTMRAGGLNVPDGGWQSGHYTGTVEHIRGDAVIGRQTAIATLH